MTISGDDPKELGVAPVSGSTKAAQADPAAPVDGPGGAAAIDGVDPLGNASSAAPVASELASGAIDGEQATARLIEQAVRAQLPPDAEAAAIQALTSEVEALLAADPTLNALLR